MRGFDMLIHTWNSTLYMKRYELPEKFLPTALLSAFLAGAVFFVISVLAGVDAREDSLSYMNDYKETGNPNYLEKAQEAGELSKEKAKIAFLSGMLGMLSGGALLIRATSRKVGTPTKK